MGSRKRVIYFAALLTALATGIFLRLPPTVFTVNAPLHRFAFLHPSAKFSNIGFDEGLYREYVNSVARLGLTSYPDIIEHYISVQKGLPGSILPPVRFLYIFSAYLWHLVFGTEALAALHNVAALFSVLTLLLSTFFAWRLKGAAFGLGIAALMASAPTQIHMSQHALVDGFFTFWALLSLWLLWENLKDPKQMGWLIAYVLALSLLVLTKENAFFVYFGIAVILVANRWFDFGVLTRELALATILGPLLGLVVLVFLAGGLDNLLMTYQLSVSKNYQLTYAILTGDGPWHRYLIDLFLVSPVVLLLAVGTVFRLDRGKKPEVFLSLFIAASYLIMCNVKYGMNLRYANIWDMPLRGLAFSQITALAGCLNQWRVWITTAAVILICALELHQYCLLFVQYPLYELVTEGLLRALHILKSR